MDKQALREQLARDIEGVYIKKYAPEGNGLFDEQPETWRRQQYPHRPYHAHTGLTPRLRSPSYGDLLTPPAEREYDPVTHKIRIKPPDLTLSPEEDQHLRDKGIVTKGLR